jgi:hypothetical protein
MGIVQEKSREVHSEFWELKGWTDLTWFYEIKALNEVRNKHEIFS